LISSLRGNILDLETQVSAWRELHAKREKQIKEKDTLLFAFSIDLKHHGLNKRGLYESLPFAFQGHVFVAEFGSLSSQASHDCFLLTMKSTIDRQFSCYASLRLEHPKRGEYMYILG